MRENLVVVSGNLTRDIELKITSSGKEVASMSVAINNDYTSNGETKKDVLFIDVTVWGNQANACATYLQKGSPVYVRGSLKMETWQDSEGKNRSKIKIIATKVQFLGQKKERPEGGVDADQTQDAI